MYSIKTSDLPTLNSYREANAYWEKAHQWRKAERGVRALTSRPNRNKTIVRYDDGRIAARLHQTDLVTYYPDNTVTLTRYDTSSSATFACAVAPHGMYGTMRSKEMWFNAAGEWYQAQEECFSLKFRKTEGLIRNPQWVIVNPENAKRHNVLNVDLAASKKVRDQLKPLINWIRAVKSLNGNNLTSVVAATGDQSAFALEDYLYDPTDVEVYPDVLRLLCDRRFMYDPIGPDSATARLAEVFMLQWGWDKNLKKLAYRSANAFVEKEVPLGSLPPYDHWRK